MDFLGKRISLFFLLALGFVFSLSGCKSYDARMMFGTGGTAGTYYAYGGVLAQYMRNFANVKVTAVSTGGSKVNVQSIQDGDYQLGFAQSDVMTYAWNGTRAFEKDGATHDFRVLGSLYDETVQLFTMNKDIKTVQDLKGKKVSVGASGSGVYFNAIDVLTAAGLTLDDIKPQFQSFGDYRTCDDKRRLFNQYRRRCPRTNYGKMSVLHGQRTCGKYLPRANGTDANDCGKSGLNRFGKCKRRNGLQIDFCTF